MRMKKDKQRLAKTNKEQARLHLQEVCEPQRLGNSVDDINSRRINAGEVKNCWNGTARMEWKSMARRLGVSQAPKRSS